MPGSTTPRALWSWEALVAASGGVADGTPQTAIAGFSIDSRAIAPGDVFVALTDQRDGHAFVTAAFAAGAVAALVSSTYARKPGDGALLRVAEPLAGLQEIGRAARARLANDARVVAVTGSAGKTGTKEMLRACLSRLGRTHAPEKSFNNHWGVPLTLARMPADTRYGVFEIGMNHAGEITPLTKLVRPHVAIITNVLPVHLGHFANEEGIADAKAEIFAGLEPGGTAIINRDNAHFARLMAAASAISGVRLCTFGRTIEADVRLTGFELGVEETQARVWVGHDSGPCVYQYEVGAPGEHYLMNSLAVAGALSAIGADVDTGLAALADFAAPAGRGQREAVIGAKGGILLIDESYNANPASMRAALATLALVPREAHPRRIAVLGDMLELGERSAELHRGLADAIDAAGVDLVFASGPLMRGLFDALPQGRRGGWAQSSNDLCATLFAPSTGVRDGDAVVVKGSLGSRMGPVVTALREHFGATP